MVGQVELRTATIWAELRPGVKASLKYWKKGQPNLNKSVTITTNSNDWYSPVKFNLVDLEMNTTYEYSISSNSNNKNTVLKKGSFMTKDLWQWRKPAPGFTFLAGSCAYFNDPQYDRPGKPYGNDSSIFISMAKEKAAFMLWLGDNWYTREADYFSEWGLWYRASRDRSHAILQDFLSSTSHFAIWDDHDYGPNNANSSYEFREASREVFKQYWANPSFGQNNEGIYTKVNYGDVDVFMMDDRYFRSADELDTIVSGKLNQDKRMWGAKQMNWLKNALATSNATFKIIASGSQFINTLSTSDCLTLFPVEFNELMHFLEDQKIEGVVFISGDRHHSEVIRYDRSNAYTLYDITTSSMTAGISKPWGKEIEHPNRVANTLVVENNYARFSVSGDKNERELKVDFVDRKGETLASWSINEKDLKFASNK